MPFGDDLDAASLSLPRRIISSTLWFQKRQKKRLAAYALERYGVHGHVLPFDRVAEMLHETYRDRTLTYFAKHEIKWSAAHS